MKNLHFWTTNSSFSSVCIKISWSSNHMSIFILNLLLYFYSICHVLKWCSIWSISYSFCWFKSYFMNFLMTIMNFSPQNFFNLVFKRIFDSYVRGFRKYNMIFYSYFSSFCCKITGSNNHMPFIISIRYTNAMLIKKQQLEYKTQRIKLNLWNLTFLAFECICLTNSIWNWWCK